MKKNKKSGARRKAGTGSKLVLAIVTMINLGLTLSLSLMRRQEILRAVNEDGKVKLLLEQDAAQASQTVQPPEK